MNNKPTPDLIAEVLKRLWKPNNIPIAISQYITDSEIDLMMKIISEYTYQQVEKYNDDLLNSKALIYDED